MKQIAILALSLLFMFSGCGESIKGELIFVESNSDQGFNYPYYLFIPERAPSEQELFVIIEPNNSGFVDDDLQKHVEKAARTASKDFYLGNYVAQALKFPLLVPVFPRSKTNWKIYSHALDRDAILQKDNDLERIDLQLIAMFEDARSKLREMDYLTRDQFLLTGFSASATFANRFTLIHPDRVYATAAGGLNGLLMLPNDVLAGDELIYPVGTSDFTELLGQDFQSEAFKNTPQFYFMGALDDNDAIPYDDGYDSAERSLIYKLIGETMQPDRWEYSQQKYREMEVNVKLITYPDTGHEHPDYVKKEVVDFFREFIQ